MKKKLLTNGVLFSENAFDLRNETNGFGLLNGYAGIAIIYYLLAKQNKEKAFEEKGLYLLEWISECGASIGDIGFGKGLAGIGWSIEWLVQNELMGDTNTDEILEPIDNVLYNAVSYNKDNNPSLFNGTIGKIAYFLRRAMSCNPGTHRFKTIGHLECLVLLIDDLANMMCRAKITSDISKENHETSEQNISISLSNLGEILTSITAINVHTNTPTLGVILFDSIKYTEAILSDIAINSITANDSQNNNYFEFLYLAVCYLIAAKNQDNKYWESKATSHIQRLVSIYDKNNNMLSFEQLFQKLAIYSLLNVHLPSLHYRKEIENLLAILSVIEMPFTLFNGRGALVIAEICLINPGLIKNWHELMFFDPYPSV